MFKCTYPPTELVIKADSWQPVNSFSVCFEVICWHNQEKEDNNAFSKDQTHGEKMAWVPWFNCHKTQKSKVRVKLSKFSRLNCFSGHKPVNDQGRMAQKVTNIYPRNEEHNILHFEAS